MDPTRERGAERIEHLGADPETPAFFDLSKTGVCCFYKKLVESGVQVQVRINELKVSGRVAHSTERRDGFRVGIQFTDVTPEQDRSLVELVDKYSKGVPVTCNFTEGAGTR